jgi:ribosomal protein S18 acetylase RimI-like enzyme
MTVLIRPYRAVDEQAVIDLWTAELPATAPHNEPATTIRKKVESGCDLFYVAVVDSVVAGTVMGGYDGHRGWIYTVAVSSAYRRRRIGTALLRHVEQALADRGCLKINLQVRTSNAGVIEFYGKLGYSLDDVISMGKRMYPETS